MLIFKNEYRYWITKDTNNKMCEEFKNKLLVNHDYLKVSISRDVVDNCYNTLFVSSSDAFYSFEFKNFSRYLDIIYYSNKILKLNSWFDNFNTNLEKRYQLKNDEYMEKHKDLTDRIAYLKNFRLVLCRDKDNIADSSKPYLAELERKESEYSTVWNSRLFKGDIPQEEYEDKYYVKNKELLSKLNKIVLGLKSDDFIVHEKIEEYYSKDRQVALFEVDFNDYKIHINLW
jgi:hypothetical protein